MMLLNLSRKINSRQFLIQMLHIGSRGTFTNYFKDTFKMKVAQINTTLSNY